MNFVETVSDLTDAVSEVYLATENHVLIEAFLPGREYCIAVCGPVTAAGGQLTRHEKPFVFAAIERVLESDERVFTSMDLKPITTSRVRSLDPNTEADVIAELQKVGSQTFSELNLETIVRLDVRADESGKIHVLEANPKPDLKAPTPEKTSIVCAGLKNYGMSYDDLILSLLADRIDLLFAARRGTVNELSKLLD